MTLRNYVSNSYFRIQKENSAEAAYLINRKKFIVSSSIGMTKGTSADDNYYGSAPYNEDSNLKTTTYDIYIDKKPDLIPHTSFRYSMSAEFDKYSYDREYHVRPMSINYSYDEFTFISSVFSKDYRLRRNIFASTRADWRFYSSAYTSYQGNSYYQDKSRIENAYGNAQVRWTPTKRTTAGAEYLWARARGAGSGSWAPYISYSPVKKMNMRLSAHYRPELASEGIDYPEDIQGETFDLAWRTGRSDYLTASFDLDSQKNGSSLYMLSYTGKRRFGDFSFSAYKHYDYYNSGPFSPYRYTLYFSFR